MQHSRVMKVAYWFRNDLRLHDSPALQAALNLRPEALYPIWCWDPHYVYHARVGPNRWRFLLDAMADLSSSISTATNAANGLLVLRGDPLVVLPTVLQAWTITHLVFEQDTDTYGRHRDEQVLAICKGLGIAVITETGRTLWDPVAMTRVNGGKPIMTFAAVQKCAAKLGLPPRPLPAPTVLPPAADTTLPKERVTQKNPEKGDYNAKFRENGTDSVSCYDDIRGPGGTFSVPTMEELDLKPATSPHRGGERRALEALREYTSDTSRTALFEKPKTNPGTFLPPETTLLSPHLHFGSLSIRLFYWTVVDIIKRYGKGAAKEPVNLPGQLLFREMYFDAQFAVPNYEQTRGNAHCRFIPWHLQNTYSPTTGAVTGYDAVSDPVAETTFKRWRTGLTGFPWIDAIMRQLVQDGWIHHLARHSVACFLTRGHAYISWERGADVFQEYLIDHETAANIGNWQWLSCSAFFSQYFRVYSPVAFGKKWDPKGGLIRRYVPELKNVPDRYIYEPWKMSIADQKQAGVDIIPYDPLIFRTEDTVARENNSKEEDHKGKSGGTTAMHMRGVYPMRVFDEKEQSKIALNGMKAAYAQHINGADPRVFDGSATALIHGSTGLEKEVATTVSKRKAGQEQSTLRGAAKRSKPDEEVLCANDDIVTGQVVASDTDD